MAIKLLQLCRISSPRQYLKIERLSTPGVSAAPGYWGRLVSALLSFKEVERRSWQAPVNSQLICFIYPSSWWFMAWQTLLSMNRDKRHRTVFWFMFMASDKDIAKNPMRRKLYPLVTNTMYILTLGTVPIISWLLPPGSHWQWGHWHAL